MGWRSLENVQSHPANNYESPFLLRAQSPLEMGWMIVLLQIETVEGKR